MSVRIINCVHSFDRLMCMSSNSKLLDILSFKIWLSNCFFIYLSSSKIPPNPFGETLLDLITIYIEHFFIVNVRFVYAKNFFL